MADSIVFTIDKGSEWERVIAALHGVDVRLPAELRRKIRKAIDPLVVRAQAKVESMPTHGRGSTGLRREVGTGVETIEVGFGNDYTIRVITTMDHADETIIPLGMDRPTGWRHPVFGNRNNWVQQIPIEHGWFTNAFANAGEGVEQALIDALEWARDTIAAAG